MKKLIATTAAFALALPGVALADPPRHALRMAITRKSSAMPNRSIAIRGCGVAMMTAIIAAAAMAPLA